ncbi:rhodanese-like domain-containing protein [Almyronema epifaneia]|uniref:Rhodanese-like domain-containing protein n=1 Tax=Almyronema epifaneia S1 TaxID=2991925 RepID=A0ABW6I9X3_9CYAN
MGSGFGGTGRRLMRSLAWSVIKPLIRWRFPQVKHLSPTALSQRLQADRPLVLLDSREAAEFAVSHLQGARHTPTLKEALQQSLALDAEIVTYCSVGYRSSRLAQQLQAKGYQRVYNLEGSIFAWMNQGYPVFQQGQPTQLVHPYNSIWSGLLSPAIVVSTCPKT